MTSQTSESKIFIFTQVCHSADCLCFEVRDKDHAYAEFIGAVFIPTNGALIAGEVIEGWFPICGKQGTL